MVNTIYTQLDIPVRHQKMQTIKKSNRLYSDNCTLFHPPVMIHEHVDDVFEEFRLFGAEESSADLIHNLFELRQTLVVFPGIVSRLQTVLLL